MRHDGRMQANLVGIHCLVDEAPLQNHALKIDGSKTEQYFGDITGQPLPAELVKAARAKEMEYFASKGVWSTRPVAEAMRVKGRKPITVRWVDVNKGDDDNPVIRSRLGARDIRGAGVESMFCSDAST